MVLDFAKLTLLWPCGIKQTPWKTVTQFIQPMFYTSYWCFAFLNSVLSLSAKCGQRVPLDTKIYCGITGLVYVNVWVTPDTKRNYVIVDENVFRWIIPCFDFSLHEFHKLVVKMKYVREWNMCKPWCLQKVWWCARVNAWKWFLSHPFNVKCCCKQAVWPHAAYCLRVYGMWYYIYTLGTWFVFL